MTTRRFSRQRQCSRRHFRSGLALSLPVTILFLCACVSPSEAAGTANTTEATGQEQDEIPPVETVSLLTNDGLRFAADFYPSNKGKEAVPIVLLHMEEGSRKDFTSLALLLQKKQHAVFVPDLRGHGEAVPDADSRTKLSKNDYLRMVTADMEAVKDFLRAKTNAGELNIEKLGIVGAEMGASVAMTWAQLDWSRPPVGTIKTGQDVKALVLISPVWNTPGLPLRSVLTNSNTPYRLTDPLLIGLIEKGAIAFRNPLALDMRREISVLIVAGDEDSKAVSDAQRLHKMLESYHNDPYPRGQTVEDLFYGTLDTSLQGTKILGHDRLDLEGLIVSFIDKRLVKQQFPWQRRMKDPHAGE
jgi:pimeloyl-ACP methyl ester carboxylesterase